MRSVWRASSLLALCVLADGAAAATVAGWDFSQWVGDSLLSTDNQTLRNTLPANYSTLDPTNNAGAESAAFGTLYFNGQFGSTSVPLVGDGSEPFVPVAGSLASNLDAPAEALGDNPFDSHQILAFEGQAFQSFLSMGATSALQVVFSADLSSVSQSGSSWRVTFGARATAPSALGIDFSTDGTAFTSAGSVSLTDADTPFSVNLSAAPTERLFVRLRFTPPPGGAQYLDNVAVQATLAQAGDRDSDGIPDASDRCPHFASGDQTDIDADGRGNVCECTDQNGDGRNTVSDLIAINAAIFNPGQVTSLCDGNNDGLCNVSDITAANLEIFSPTNTSTCSRQPVPGP
jgi:hypothetical protein